MAGDEGPKRMRALRQSFGGEAVFEDDLFSMFPTGDRSLLLNSGATPQQHTYLEDDASPPPFQATFSPPHGQHPFKQSVAPAVFTSPPAVPTATATPHQQARSPSSSSSATRLSSGWLFEPFASLASGSRDSSSGSATDDPFAKLEFASRDSHGDSFFAGFFPNLSGELPSHHSSTGSNRSSSDDGIVPVTPSAFSFLPVTSASSSNSISTLPPTTQLGVRDDEQPFFRSSGGAASAVSDDEPAAHVRASSPVMFGRGSGSSSSSSSSSMPLRKLSGDDQLGGSDSDLSERVGVASVIQPRINGLRQMAAQIEEKIGQLAREQRELPKPYSREHTENLFAKQNHVRVAIEWCAQQIQLMHQNYLLFPPDIYALMTLQGKFYQLVKQTELYQLEVQHYSLTGGGSAMQQQPPPPKHLISMIIVRQPFPKPLKQGSSSSSSTEDPIVVVLLHGANTKVQPLSKVQAVVIHEEYQSKAVGFLSQVKIISEDQPFDADLCASFSDIRFDKGTRLKVVRLQFTAKVQYTNYDGSSGVFNLESEATNPFIVITNESQWDQSEGVLFSKEAFPVNQVPWIQFANILQMHYLRTTRQDPKNPERPLSVHDLNYIIRSQFNNKRSITQKDFMDFWEGFGKIMHKIRHQKPFGLLWVRGLVWGFISKAEAEELLQNQPPGTFVTRFSERVPGKLAIAYVKKDPRYGSTSISHYLVAPHDKKDLLALPDFLSENECYVSTLLVNTEFNPPASALVVGSIHKDTAFGPFYTKQNLSSSSLEGYENITRKKTQRPL